MENALLVKIFKLSLLKKHFANVSCLKSIRMSVSNSYQDSSMSECFRPVLSTVKSVDSEIELGRKSFGSFLSVLNLINRTLIVDQTIYICVFDLS